MGLYIVLMKFTDAGVRQIRDSPKRASVGLELCNAMGVRCVTAYPTMGEYDWVETFEAPDDITMAKFVLAHTSKGFVRSTTLKAFTEEQWSKIISELPPPAPAV